MLENQDDQFNNMSPDSAQTSFLPMSQNWHDEFEIFTFSPISVGHVHKLLKGIPIRKAFGLDGVNGQFLTAGASVIA